MSTIRSGEPTPLPLRHAGAVTLTRAILSDAAVAAAEAHQNKAAQAGKDDDDDSHKVQDLPRLDTYA